MELNVTISALALLIVALASIGGGLVLYRGSRRVGWRAVGMSAVALGVGVLLVFVLILPVSTEGEAPEPAIELGKVTSAQPTDAPTTSQEPTAPVSSSMMVPRPESIEVLVRMSHIIVPGTISAVLDEIRFGAYGEDGNPYIPGEESGTPYTDYEVRVESVLKNDGDVEDGGTLVLRMYGHLSQQNDVTLAAVQLPQPGSHYLLALGRNPDGTYGSGSEGLIYVDGETVAYADGVAFSTELTGEGFVEAVRQKAAGHDAPAPDLTHGSPPPPAPSGSPLAALKFHDVNYVASGGAQLPSGEGAAFVIDGTEINVDDLELVGSTDESNTGYPGATGAGLMIYRLKGGETNHVYEFRPGKDHVNPEDGQIFKGQDSWTRWTTH